MPTDGGWGFADTYGATTGSPMGSIPRECDDGEWGFDSDQYSGSNFKFSDVTSMNLFEATKTAIKNGIATMTSLSEFTSLLSRLGVDGPRHLKMPLRIRAVKVGEGSQFTVFKARSHDLGADYSPEGDVVMKRVNVTRLDISKNRNLALNPKYRAHMRTLELEVLSLCHPNIRNHRNIVSLVAWGYDYDDGATPLPVLFTKAANSTLSAYLKLTPRMQRWDVRQHIALDIAAGLAVMHQFNIVHGDVKPDNVLIFTQNNPKVPFVAKLSDFGVCIDMQAADSKLTPESYCGTPAWTGPETKGYIESKHGEFSANLLLQFDSYSYGMVLLAIFVTSGGVPRLDQNRESNETDAETAVRLLVERGTPPPGFGGLGVPLMRALRGLLAEQPTLRPFPSPSLLRTDTASYRDWILDSEVAPKTTQRGLGPNTGVAYWSSLDDEVLTQLDLQYVEHESSQKVSRFPSETLFGMAQRFARNYSKDYVAKTLKYVLAAAKQGYSPARAVCQRVFEAQNRPIDVDPTELNEWTFRAVCEGFLFAPGGILSPESHKEAREIFRSSGGYCNDKFQSIPAVITTIREVGRLRVWILQHHVNYLIDSRGNCMIHVAAALGETEAVRFLIDHAGASVDTQNDNGETPVYKACQGGHPSVAKYLLERGANASLGSRSCGLTPLHWLFNFRDTDIPDIGRLLVQEGQADVNKRILPRGSTETLLQQSIPSFHFPFAWPAGSPLHWAVFSRNYAAMDTLLNLGANIHSTYEGGDSSTTALALATLWGDSGVVCYLISKGADPTIADFKGRNLLHLMSFPPTSNGAGGFGQRFQYWIRHGKWADHLRAIKETVGRLVDAGVDIECRARVYQNCTPIIWATDNLRDTAVICALLDYGADINNVRGAFGRSLLHMWAEVDARVIDYSEAYLFTLDTIAGKTIDKNACDLAGDTALHAMARVISPEQTRNSVMALVTGRDIDIDVQNRDGVTPLLYALGAATDTMVRGETFLEFGARPDITTPQGRNTIFEITHNDRLMDSQSSSLIRRYISLIDTPKRPTFIDATNIEALWVSCSSGRYATVEYLLDLGMNNRINEVCQRLHQSALDFAFRHAEMARRAYIRRIGAYKSGGDREASIEGKACYGYDAKVTDMQGQRSWEVVEEAYWSFPKLLRLLQSRGALPARDITTPPVLLSCEDDPAWFDGWEIYSSGNLPENQPNKAHWDILYSLEHLPQGWEEQLKEVVDEAYEDPRILPSLMMLDRLAWVREIIEKRSVGPWVKALSVDTELVEVRMSEGKIVEIRDEDGRPVDIHKR